LRAGGYLKWRIPERFPLRLVDDSGRDVDTELLQRLQLLVGDSP
jgi:hypothetical protein